MERFEQYAWRGFIALATLAVFGLGYILLSWMGEYAWVTVSEKIGYEGEEPPFFVMLVFLVGLPLLHKLPWNLNRSFELTDWCIIDKPADAVWNALSFAPGARHYLPFVHKVEDFPEEPDTLRLLMKHGERKVDVTKSTTSLMRKDTEAHEKWIRYSFTRQNGLPAWDRKLRWIAYNFYPEADGRTRVQITKCINRPRVWALPLYYIFNPATYDASCLRAHLEGGISKAWIHHIWLGMFPPESTYQGWDSDAMAEIGIHSELHKWVLVGALAMPLFVVMVVFGLMDFA